MPRDPYFDALSWELEQRMERDLEREPRRDYVQHPPERKPLPLRAHLTSDERDDLESAMRTFDVSDPLVIAEVMNWADELKQQRTLIECIKRGYVEPYIEDGTLMLRLANEARFPAPKVGR